MKNLFLGVIVLFSRRGYHCLPRAKKRGMEAFSLIELLVVMAIIAILVGTTVPAINSLMNGYNVTSTASEVTSVLSLARQQALALNSDVYVVFYKFGTPAEYRAVQLFQATVPDQTQTQTYVPLSKPYLLGNTTVIATDPGTQSTLFSAPGITNLPNLPTYPQLGTTPSNEAFCFIPDGTTNLGLATDVNNNTSYPTLLVADSKTLPASGLPSNYAMVQINPYNGAARVFRP